MWEESSDRGSEKFLAPCEKWERLSRYIMISLTAPFSVSCRPQPSFLPLCSSGAIFFHLAPPSTFSFPLSVNFKPHSLHPSPPTPLSRSNTRYPPFQTHQFSNEPFSVFHSPCLRVVREWECACHPPTCDRAIACFQSSADRFPINPAPSPTSSNTSSTIPFLLSVFFKPHRLHPPPATPLSYSTDVSLQFQTDETRVRLFRSLFPQKPHASCVLAYPPSRFSPSCLCLSLSACFPCLLVNTPTTVKRSPTRRPSSAWITLPSPLPFTFPPDRTKPSCRTERSLC